MKKTLIAAAALAVAGVASAQVTLSGTVGFGIQNTSADKAARFNLENADIKFAASEDLGGGMKASASVSFEAEGGRGEALTAQTNNFTLSGGFGTIQYNTLLSGAAKVASISAEDDMNDILGGFTPVEGFAYTLPKFGNVSVTIEKWGANTKTSATQLLAGEPKNWDINIAYTDGPIWLYYEGNSTYTDLRASYDFGAAKLAGRAKSADGKDPVSELMLTMPMGATTFGVGYAKQGTAAGTGVQAAYALSKQTTVTAAYVTAKNWLGGTSKAGSGNNYRLQINKNF